MYTCEICKVKYKEEKWAKKCEEWCKKNKSCNLKIIKHAAKIGTVNIFKFTIPTH